MKVLEIQLCDEKHKGVGERVLLPWYLAPWVRVAYLSLCDNLFCVQVFLECSVWSLQGLAMGLSKWAKEPLPFSRLMTCVMSESLLKRTLQSPWNFLTYSGFLPFIFVLITKNSLQWVALKHIHLFFLKSRLESLNNYETI
jgi:hypothetical protein